MNKIKINIAIAMVSGVLTVLSAQGMLGTEKMLGGISMQRMLNWGLGLEVLEIIVEVGIVGILIYKRKRATVLHA